MKRGGLRIALYRSAEALLASMRGEIPDDSSLDPGGRIPLPPRCWKDEQVYEEGRNFWLHLQIFLARARGNPT